MVVAAFTIGASRVGDAVCSPLSHPCNRQARPRGEPEELPERSAERGRVIVTRKLCRVSWRARRRYCRKRAPDSIRNGRASVRLDSLATPPGVRGPRTSDRLSGSASAIRNGLGSEGRAISRGGLPTVRFRQVSARRYGALAGPDRRSTVPQGPQRRASATGTSPLNAIARSPGTAGGVRAPTTRHRDRRPCEPGPAARREHSPHCERLG